MASRTRRPACVSMSVWREVREGGGDYLLVLPHVRYRRQVSDLFLTFWKPLAAIEVFVV